MKRKIIIVASVCLIVVAITYLRETTKQPVSLQTALTPPVIVPPTDGLTLEDLAGQAIRKFQSTKNDPSSRHAIEGKVREAVALIQKEGLSSFSKFRGNSPFVFAGTYLWIHTKGKATDPIWIVIHPVDPIMEITPLEYGKPDIYNRHFLRIMNEAIASNDKSESWVCYDWHAPGEIKPIKKAAFVKLAIVNGTHYVVGGGTSRPSIVAEVYSDPTTYKAWEQAL